MLEFMPKTIQDSFIGWVSFLVYVHLVAEAILQGDDTDISFMPGLHSRQKPEYITQSPDMLALLSQLKKKYRLKVAVISNEGRELAEYRIKQFKLNALADFFIVSSFVHFRKPHADIFQRCKSGNVVSFGRLCWNIN